MRAAKLKERPDFTLMKQTDIHSIYHMQMPRWLFSDPRYCDMDLETKVAYTFLLNRFQLSRRNGWVNDYGEVFVIFPRKAMAKELRVCVQRVSAAFKKLSELNLIWEKRCGRGDANQIYLATVVPMEDVDYECAPFIAADTDDCDSRNADSDGLAQEEPQKNGTPAPKNHGQSTCGASIAGQETQNPTVKNDEIGDSRDADIAIAEVQNLCPSYKELSYIDFSEKEVSQSVPPAGWCGTPPVYWPTDNPEDELVEILEDCELYCFDPEVAKVFENAVERLFYSDSVRLGNATLPQNRVRRKLHQLDGMILQEAHRKLSANLERDVKNSTAYTMTTIMNCIAESESDLMVDPYLNSIRASP